MLKRDASCPLCGARLSAEQVLANCDDVVDLAQGVLACHCPFCQGYFEVRTSNGGLEIGYLRHGRFDTVVVLPDATGLQTTIGRDGISLKLNQSAWHFEN